MQVFMLRFRELKEKDVILSKLQKKDFDQKNIETIKEFDISRDYAILLQENNYFNKNTYLALMQHAHEKLVEAEAKNPGRAGLQLKLDHFFHSQSQKMVQEQLKYLCTAVRAENTLREHMEYQNERRRMRDLIKRSQIFQNGLSTSGKNKNVIKDKESQLISEEVKVEIDKEGKQVKRMNAVDENLKYGRRKKTANLFKNSQEN